MSIWSKIGGFLSETFATLGDNVNDLTQAVVRACKPDFRAPRTALGGLVVAARK